VTAPNPFVHVRVAAPSRVGSPLVPIDQWALCPAACAAIVRGATDPTSWIPWPVDIVRSPVGERLVIDGGDSRLREGSACHAWRGQEQRTAGGDWCNRGPRGRRVLQSKRVAVSIVIMWERLHAVSPTFFAFLAGIAASLAANVYVGAVLGQRLSPRLQFVVALQTLSSFGLFLVSGQLEELHRTYGQLKPRGSDSEQLWRFLAAKRGALVLALLVGSLSSFGLSIYFLQR